MSVQRNEELSCRCNFSSYITIQISDETISVNRTFCAPVVQVQRWQGETLKGSVAAPPWKIYSFCSFQKCFRKCLVFEMYTTTFTKKTAAVNVYKKFSTKICPKQLHTKPTSIRGKCFSLTFSFIAVALRCGTFPKF